jgi:hypothetical protein
MVVELPRELAEDAFWTRMPPPLLSVVVIGLAFGFEVLLGVAGSDGTAAGEAFVHSVPWTVWRSVTGAALVVFVLLTAQAVRILQNPGKWGFHPQPVRQRHYVMSATAAAAAVLAYRFAFPGKTPDLPVQYLTVRTDVVLVAALVAAVPWLAVVWLAHAECRNLDEFSEPDIGNEYAGAIHDASHNPVLFRKAVKQLLGLWELLIFCAGAFTLGVVAAVASAGALRGAFVSVYPKRAGEFPPANVLLYGGLFALGLSAIALPMATAWRNRAQQLVEHVSPLPKNGRPTQAWTQERQRLEHLLHLDTPVVRNPLTLVGILAPLAVSALAAFLPELAN